ncbi:MAG: precorrin-2 dehydrogenase/sirohydrochlorin ferrochelatase family protein [Gemmatimonadaceae bacterium]
MSGYPVMLDGESIRALIVGGGRVATRKARVLMDAGATVRVVAPEVDEELATLANAGRRLTLERRRFADHDVDGATIIIAATADRSLNARIAALARDRGRLVSVADHPAEGNFVAMATHRAGDVVIGVSAGGVPRAAARIRDAIGARIDARYARAIASLRTLRRRLIEGEARAEWHRAMNSLIDDRFCARVEAGTLAAEADAWR